MQGAQRPRHLSLPPRTSSAGQEAVELAALAGLVLDPWEAFVLEHALAEREDGRWAAFEVGVVVPRQNGKGAILEARELAGLFLLRERLIIHSAHQFDTSLEAFRRLLTLIEDTPELDRRVKRTSKSHGEEGIELKGGSRIRFRTRTKGGGRGFTSDCLILDEAMILPEFSHGALLPTLSARPNPQVWYTGSAVDQTVHEDGVVLARIRERGIAGGAEALAYFEWSVDGRDPDAVTEELASDESAWAQANPGLGIRISAEHIGYELRSMDKRTFAVERLGIGDWPSLEQQETIALSLWDELADRLSRPNDPVGLAFDITPDRSRGAIGAAGRREDGLAHVEVIEERRGAGWIPGRLVELAERHRVGAIVCDASGPAASLIQSLEDAGLEVTTVTAREHAQACGRLYDAVHEKTLRHLGTSELRDAVRGAATRSLGDAWAWSRKSSSVNIAPLVACTLALWALETGVTEHDWGVIV